MSQTALDWGQEQARRQDGMVALRRDFHRHPELSSFQVGVKPTHDRPCPHHAPEFEMNEARLPAGLAVGLEVMRAALAPPAAS
jgi:metal-dependent amidase/aminoacylase/carboxypeptidase family protein